MKVLEQAGHYSAPGDEPSHWIEHLRVSDLSVGTYSIPAGGVDDQTPHTEDEIYVVARGRARLESDDGSAEVGPGSVLYVPAAQRHRFVDVTADLAVIVFFAPAEYSRGS
ncbi:MAG: cupin domain-containing protein [Actinomycetota bacterium]